MKNILLVLAVLCLFASLGEAQFNRAPNSQIGFNSLTYADSDADTSATYMVGGVDQLTLRVYASDSVSVVYHFDYRVYGASSWSAVSAASADTVITTAAGYSQIVLRDHSLERIPGLTTQLRVRAAFAASANSAGSGATHKSWFEWGN